MPLHYWRYAIAPLPFSVTFSKYYSFLQKNFRIRSLLWNLLCRFDVCKTLKIYPFFNFENRTHTLGFLFLTNSATPFLSSPLNLEHPMYAIAPSQRTWGLLILCIYTHHCSSRSLVCSTRVLVMLIPMACFLESNCARTVPRSGMKITRL